MSPPELFSPVSLSTNPQNRPPFKPKARWSPAASLPLSQAISHFHSCYPGPPTCRHLCSPDQVSGLRQLLTHLPACTWFPDLSTEPPEWFLKNTRPCFLLQQNYTRPANGVACVTGSLLALQPRLQPSPPPPPVPCSSHAGSVVPRACLLFPLLRTNAVPRFLPRLCLLSSRPQTHLYH